MYTNSDTILDSYHNIILQENVQKILCSFWLLKALKAAAKLKFSIGGPSKSIHISVSSVLVFKPVSEFCFSAIKGTKPALTACSRHWQQKTNIGQISKIRYLIFVFHDQELYLFHE